MKHLFRKLSCLLVIGGVIACLGVLAALGPVQAETCTLNKTPPANTPPQNDLKTGANVIAAFNYARKLERPPCNVSLSIDPAAYDAAKPEKQVLLLIMDRRPRPTHALGVRLHVHAGLQRVSRSTGAFNSSGDGAVGAESAADRQRWAAPGRSG